MCFALVLTAKIKCSFKVMKVAQSKDIPFKVIKDNADIFANFILQNIIDGTFVEEVDIMSYADDNAPYVCSENAGVTLEKLEEVGKVIFNGFQTISEKQMQINIISF